MNRLPSEIFIQYPLFIVFISLVIIFPFLSHPLSIGGALLLITIILALILSSVFTHIWLSYTLVLILLGGLLVSFIYIALVASNEQFNIVKINFFGPLIFSNCLIAILLIKKDYIFNTNENQSFLNNTIKLEWISEFYSYNLGVMTIYIVFYLLLTLLVVVAITKNTQITLRSQQYGNFTFNPPSY